MPGEPSPRTTTVEATGPHPARRARGRPGSAVLVAVGAGGALGSVARYEVAMVAPRTAGGFPWATFAVNVTGSLILGLLVTLVVERWPPTRYVRPFAGIGICGGYTTWSTFMTDSALLVRDGHAALAALYGAATLTCGLAATYVGIGLGRSWPVDRRSTS